VGKNIGGCGENRKVCCRCGQRQRERRKNGEEGVKAGESLALITGGRRGEEGRWTSMNVYIIGSADAVTCVIRNARFRMLDPLLVYSPFNRSTLHVK
jgi:hypothetical protein